MVGKRDSLKPAQLPDGPGRYALWQVQEPHRELKFIFEVVSMAARLTDKRKKKIIADYLELGSYNATAKRNGVCGQTVRRVIEESQDFSENLKQKNAENTADIIAYMESKRQAVCDIIEVGLKVLPQKIQDARTASEVTTAIGTLIDKFTAFGSLPGESAKEDDLSKSLREMAEALRSDD